jgi:hypothetical protein
MGGFGLIATVAMIVTRMLPPTSVGHDEDGGNGDKS